MSRSASSAATDIMSITHGAPITSDSSIGPLPARPVTINGSPRFHTTGRLSIRVSIFTKARKLMDGQHHPYLQPLHLVQDRRPAGLVDPLDVDPVRQLHRRNCSLYRLSEKLRQRRRFRNRPRFSGNHFPAYSGFRQRAISRRCRCGAQPRNCGSLTAAAESLEKRAEVDLRRFCCFRADFGTAEFPLSDKPRIALSLERSELDFAPAALRKLRISQIFH